MRQFFALFLLLTSTSVFAESPDLLCERRSPQERIVAKAVNVLARPYDLFGDGELVVYDVFDNPIERHSFPVATEVGPSQEVLVHQAVLYHGSLMAYCVFNVDDSAYR